MQPAPWIVSLLIVASAAAHAQTPGAPPQTAPMPPAADVAAPAPAPDPMALGRQNTAWFYAGEIDRLWQSFSEPMKKRLDAEKMQALRGQIESQLGTETSVVSEKMAPDPKGRQAYTRVAKFSKTDDLPIVVQWTFDEHGNADGFVIHPEQQQ